MKREFILTLVLFTLTAAWSCKKVIQVDLNSAAPQIVIEGEVTNMLPPYSVKITRTVNFDAANNFPAVSGATVQITDSNAAQTYMLPELAPGVYVTSAFAGLPGHTYLLSVTMGGRSYTASSTMPAPIPLDSISFVDNFDLKNKRAINAVANFQDPSGLGNDYRFVETVNGVQLPDIFVFEDRLSDGKYIRQTLYNDTSTLHANDALKVDMYCVDKSVYDYFFSLFQVTGNSGFQSASPANPNTNLSNGALGYFSAHTVSSKNITVY
jgi:hypothetical protein